MPIRHQLIDTDTVEYLALKYYGDPTQWRNIVDYNNLVYPYVSDDESDRLAVFANGYVHVTRPVATQPITIKSGWTLLSQHNVMSSITKTYEVVNDVTLGVGVTDGYIYVRSIVPGVQGNIAQGMITELGQDFTVNGVTNISVINDSPIVNGVEGFIRTTGEYVFIPSDEDVVTLNDHGTAFSYQQMQYFYGSDLQLDVSDDLMIDLTAGDLQTISYTDNVVQAVNRRLSTEKGDILSDFTFGNGVADIIGDNSLPMEAKQRLIEVEILEALNYEDRISDPVVNSITIDTSTLSCYVDLSMTVVKLGASISFDNMRLGGIF